MKRLYALVAAFAVATSGLQANEIGFIEKFSLQEDREAALAELIPGTDDYFYYHCLHNQHEGRLDEVDELIKQWKAKRRTTTDGAWEILYRQALLRYDQNPDQSLEFIRQRLGLSFNHAKDNVNAQRKLPSNLDPNTVNTQAFWNRSVRHHRGVDGITPHVHNWVMKQKLDREQRRKLLSRLPRPDFPGLTDLIIVDLKDKYAKPFGNYKVHNYLTRAQLDKLATAIPDLLDADAFIHAYLQQLRPGADENSTLDPKAREAWLNRMWSFVEKLEPAKNSLKAHVLYGRLVHDRALGIYDPERFLSYLKLPRNIHYVNSDYLKRPAFRNSGIRCDLNRNYQAYTAMTPIHNDETLVADYLANLLRSGIAPKTYTPYLQNTWYKNKIAEFALLDGRGDAQTWQAQLSPSTLRSIRDRVEVVLAPQNPTRFGIDDEVKLAVDVKNVSTFLVKVFEINALNYYRDANRDVATNIHLDGLVANSETSHTYKEAPIRRVRRTFSFPELKKRGTYVVEFIGNGRSSRALIHKGGFRLNSRFGTAGQILTVFDERNQQVSKARIHLNGTEYVTDENGDATIPYSNRPQQVYAVVSDGTSASRIRIHKATESYQLSAGFNVDRESLVRRGKAEVLIRAGLAINGEPVSLGILEDVSLMITSTDHDGIASTMEKKGLKLSEGADAKYEFQVPENLSNITFELRGKIQSLSKNKKINVHQSRSIVINQINKSAQIKAAHLGKTTDGYVVDLLGLNGEPQINHALTVTVRHRGFRHQHSTELRTDEAGRVSLGHLPEISLIRVNVANTQDAAWPLLADSRTHHPIIHSLAGKLVRVPYPGNETKVAREHLSLIQVADTAYRKDYFDALAINNGFIEFSDLPAGDYQLRIQDKWIDVRLTNGQQQGRYLNGPYRYLETARLNPLQIESVKGDAESVSIKVANASQFTRVHVIATRYVPRFHPFSALDRLPIPGLAVNYPNSLESLYESGRDIGDEYRYILERQGATKFPGNMLKRPEILLNPWAVRTTQTGIKNAQKGGLYGSRSSAGRASGAADPFAAGGGGHPGDQDYPNLDFMRVTSTPGYNLAVNKNNELTIKRDALGDGQHLHVIAVDPTGIVYRTATMPERDLKRREVRLARAIDAGAHASQQRKTSVLAQGAQFTLADVTTSEFEVYDSLGSAYRLLSTLNSNEHLAEFAFVLNWPNLSDEKKQENYSKYACHELNFFIFRKDPKFFKENVQPYLANKKDKTFLDHWLLNNNLSQYLDPWAYSRLNVVERILLGQRLPNESAKAAKHMQELLDLIPPNVERANHLFDTAVRSTALDTDDRFALGDVLEQAEMADEIALDMEAPGSAVLFSAIAAPKPSVRHAEKKMVKRKAESAKLSLARRQLGSLEKESNKDVFYANERANKAVRQLFRQLDKTQEWAENNYYKRLQSEQNASLVQINAFWRDYANAGKAPFVSANFPEASTNFTEMLLALAVLDLPFETPKHRSEVKETSLTMTAAGPAVIFHKEILETEAATKDTPILVNQNYFRLDDRYRHVNNERHDKFVREEFLIQVVYGCQMVATNPTSTPRKLEILAQIPQGAVPVKNTRYTKGRPLTLAPYQTARVETFFYFPAKGQFGHFPVHVSKDGAPLAHGDPFVLNVVDDPTIIDKTVWEWVSQNGSNQDVLAWLNTHNANRPDYNRILFRLKDKAFFNDLVRLMNNRHVYHPKVWSYAIHHRNENGIRQFLRTQPNYLNRCGLHLNSSLLVIDPVERVKYEHLEYKPLVNARAHQLGAKRAILNNRLHKQYRNYLKYMSYRPKLTDQNHLDATYYLLLQDRVAEALDRFKKIDRKKLATVMQYDYTQAYLAFFEDELKDAEKIAKQYKDHPVPRWQNAFTNILNQIEEIQKDEAVVADKDDHRQTQDQLAATAPALDLKLNGDQVAIAYRNVEEISVNYYLMDVELLFSRNPFVGTNSGHFGYVRPNETERVKLSSRKAEYELDIPKAFESKNVMVEVSANGVRRSIPYFANAMQVQVADTYGQLRVSDTKGKGISTVYVKAYARNKDGSIKFFKDGYTDLRGRFDYASLSTNQLDNVDRFSLLVMSDKHGAMIRETAPPSR